jgi:hypothetical protein
VQTLRGVFECFVACSNAKIRAKRMSLMFRPRHQLNERKCQCRWRLLSTIAIIKKMCFILLGSKVSADVSGRTLFYRPTCSVTRVMQWTASSFRIINIWEASHFNSSVAILATSFPCTGRQFEVERIECNNLQQHMIGDLSKYPWISQQTIPHACHGFMLCASSDIR